jgi:hypothetical protein
MIGLRKMMRIFAPISAKLRIARQITDHGSGSQTRHRSGDQGPQTRCCKRLLYRPLTGTTESQSVGIARATKCDVTPAGERFYEILRKMSDRATAAKPQTKRFSKGLIASLGRD